MVFLWSRLTRGAPTYTLVQVSPNDVNMIFAHAPVVALLLGVTDIAVPWETPVLSVVFHAVIPLAAGVATRLRLTRGADPAQGQAAVAAFNARIKPLSVMGLLAIMVLLFGLQGEAILDLPLVIAMIAVALPIQSCGVFAVADWVAKAWRVPHAVAAPCALIGTSNFFQMAVAIGLIGLNAIATLVTVVGVLVEGAGDAVAGVVRRPHPPLVSRRGQPAAPQPGSRAELMHPAARVALALSPAEPAAAAMASTHRARCPAEVSTAEQTPAGRQGRTWWARPHRSGPGCRRSRVRRTEAPDPFAAPAHGVGPAGPRCRSGAVHPLTGRGSSGGSRLALGVAEHPCGVAAGDREGPGFGAHAGAAVVKGGKAGALGEQPFAVLTGAQEVVDTLRADPTSLVVTCGGSCSNAFDTTLAQLLLAEGIDVSQGAFIPPQGAAAGLQDLDAGAVDVSPSSRPETPRSSRPGA